MLFKLQWNCLDTITWKTHALIMTEKKPWWIHSLVLIQGFTFQLSIFQKSTCKIWLNYNLQHELKLSCKYLREGRAGLWLCCGHTLHSLTHFSHSHTSLTHTLHSHTSFTHTLLSLTHFIHSHTSLTQCDTLPSLCSPSNVSLQTLHFHHCSFICCCCFQCFYNQTNALWYFNINIYCIRHELLTFQTHYYI